ncbi:hypothetical protein K6959_00850 [Bacillus aquiflavi]|uniref:hypothetical protein n=1 Tax=Bacillus aquiflavi TaxID=2672567 RepID=UPI001CA8B2FD|nr:hypothetical protein [Bacillus aquiflavi]UAC48586.1 hypothetical protein K6959_00850 [Bacillus aquiflavi]
MNSIALKNRQVLQLPTNYAEVSGEEMQYIDGGGFVGFRVTFKASTRKMGAAVGGAYVAGVVGWHCRHLATAGPWGAGAAAAITAAAGGTASWAINKGLRRVNIGVNIPGVSWSKSLTI